MRARLSINKAFTQSVSVIAQALKRLGESGITVEKIECDLGGIPTLFIEKNKMCYDFIESGKAILYATGKDDKGKYNRYQFREAGCRVVFEERK